MFLPGKRLAAPILLSVVLHTAAALVAGWIIIARHRSPPASELSLATSKTSPQAEPRKDTASTNAPSPHTSLLRQQSHAIRSTVVSGWKAPPLALNPRAEPSYSADLHGFLEGAGVTSPPQSSAELVSALARGASSSPQPPFPAPQFLGKPVLGERILLLFDVSKTVANALAHEGIPMEKIRAETESLIENLGIHTRFGLVQFARNYAFFRTELAAATRANREAARIWLHRHFSTEGNLARGIPHTVTGSPGFLVALEQSFGLDPDALFILSDGNFQRGTGIRANIPWDEFESTLDRLQKQRISPAKLHFIGVATKPETALTLQRILGKHGGTFSELGR